MREIKFRAWDKKNKSMHDYGMSIRLGGGFDYDSFYWNERPDIILMQYTGLKDKNGKEIYEGDIVKDNDEVTLVIKWQGGKSYSNPCFCPVQANDESGSSGGYNSWALLEIIGNIYENPDLLSK